MLIFFPPCPIDTVFCLQYSAVIVCCLNHGFIYGSHLLPVYLILSPVNLKSVLALKVETYQISL